MINDEQFKNLFDNNDIDSSKLFDHIPDLEGGSLNMQKKKEYKKIIVHGKEYPDYQDGLALGVL